LSEFQEPSVPTRRRTVLFLLSLAQLMVILDVSAVNVALPSISHDLGIAPGDLEWTITSYSLLFGSLLLLGGRAADLLGRRRTFLAGLLAFTGASLAAGLAPSDGALYAARGAQGIGAALLSPGALSILTTTFSGRERTTALGVWGAVGGAGAAIGVLVGGVLTEWIDWRAIFFVNVPIGALVAIGVLRLVPAGTQPARWGGLDLPGAALATASLGAVLFAAAGAGDVGWTGARTLALVGTAAAGLLAFGLHERRVARPLLRFDRLADRAVAGGATLMLLASAMLIGSFLLASVYLQEVLDASALATGAGFLPIAVAAGAGAHAGSHLVRRHGLRAPVAIALALVALGALLLSRVDAGGSYVADLLPGMLLVGLGAGVTLVAVTVAVLTGAEHEDAGMLSGLNTTGHEVGGALGVAALTAVATRAIGAHADAEALANGIGDAYVAAAGIAVAALLLAVALLPPAPQFLARLRAAPEVVSMH
jgi:EmrB/QacA subfamily drug resistance transporter